MVNPFKVEQENQPAAYQGVFVSRTTTWLIADIVSMLDERQYAELDLLLINANEPAQRDVEREFEYVQVLRHDGLSLILDGQSGLAKIHAWQAASPESAFSYAMEAYYWGEWAQLHSHQLPINALSEAEWCAARLCADRCYASALKALQINPSLWQLMHLLGEISARLGAPDWLKELIVLGRIEPHELRVPRLARQEIQRELDELLAISGPRQNDVCTVPVHRPGGVAAHDQFATAASIDYWANLSLSIFPHQYYLFRTLLTYRLPRWGGSHTAMRELIYSPKCQHLSAEELDGLAHEIWRDDFAFRYANREVKEIDYVKAKVTTLDRLERAKNPLHRQECAMWLAHTEYLRENQDEALKYAHVAAHSGIIEREEDIALMYSLALAFPERCTWFRSVVIKSALRFTTHSACILYAYFSEFGLAGFTCNKDVALKWYDELFPTPQTVAAWTRLFQVMLDQAYFKEIHMMGKRAISLGFSEAAAFSLGYLYGEGLECQKDVEKALAHYQLVLKGPGDGAARNSFVIAYKLCKKTSDKESLAKWERVMIESARIAISLGNEPVRLNYHYACSELKTPALIQEVLPSLREDAHAGYSTAQGALAILCGKRENKSVFNYREGVSWLLAGEASDPDESIVKRARDEVYEANLIASLRFRYMLKRLSQSH